MASAIRLEQPRRAAQYISRAVEVAKVRNNPTPQLRLRVADGKMTVAARNGEERYTASIDVDSDAEFEHLVAYHQLGGAAVALAGETAELKVDGDILTFSDGLVRTKVRPLPAAALEQYPSDPVVLDDATVSVQLDTAQVQALKHVGAFVHDDHTKAVAYVNVEVSQGHLTAVSTDGRALHSVALDEVATDGEGAMLQHPHVFDKLAKMVATNGRVVVRSDARTVVIDAGDEVYSSSRPSVEGAYPHWRRLLPAAETVDAVVHLSNASVLTGPDAPLTKVAGVVKANEGVDGVAVAAGDGRLRLTSADADGVDLVDVSVPASAVLDVDGVASVTFKTSYLIAGLATLPAPADGETVDLHLSGAKTVNGAVQLVPALATCTSKNNRTSFLLMPMAANA